MKLKKSLAVTLTDKEIDLLLKIRKDILKTCVNEHCRTCKFNNTVFFVGWLFIPVTKN